MDIATNEVFESALSLPQSQRADLVFQLLQSLDPPGYPVSGEEFGKELHSRIDAHERGEISSSTLDEAREIIKRRLAEGRSS